MLHFYKFTMSNDSSRYKQSYICVSLQWAMIALGIDKVTFL